MNYHERLVLGGLVALAVLLAANYGPPAWRRWRAARQQTRARQPHWDWVEDAWPSPGFGQGGGPPETSAEVEAAPAPSTSAETTLAQDAT